MYTVRSMCNVNPNGGGSVKVMIERLGGFNGEIVLFGNPKNVPRQLIKAGAKEGNLSVRCHERRWVKPFGIKIYAEAVINGRKVRKEVVPADIFNQAFAYDHLLPAKEFCIGVRRFGSKNKPNKKKPEVKKAPVKK